MNVQVVISRSLAQQSPELYKQIEASVTPMLVDPKHIPEILNAVKSNFPDRDDTDVKILFTAVLYDAYCPASFLPKSAMKLPFGIRDEAARVLGYEHPENVNSWRNIAAAYIKGKQFRARVDLIKDLFKCYSTNPRDWELKF